MLFTSEFSEFTETDFMGFCLMFTSLFLAILLLLWERTAAISKSIVYSWQSQTPAFLKNILFPPNLGDTFPRKAPVCKNQFFGTNVTVELEFILVYQMSKWVNYLYCENLQFLPTPWTLGTCTIPLLHFRHKIFAEEMSDTLQDTTSSSGQNKRRQQPTEADLSSSSTAETKRSGSKRRKR